MRLNLMAAVLGAPVKYDYVVILSGQDYPIKPNRGIVSFLAQNRKRNFVHHERMPTSFWSVNGGDGGMWLIDRYHVDFLGKRISYPPTCERPDTRKGRAFIAVANFLCALRFRMPRLFPSYLVPYGGSAHLSLTREAVRYVLDFVEQHPDYLRFHRYTLNSSEIFFHTILLNAPEYLRCSIVNDNLHYESWVHTAHPEILTTRDLPELRSTSKPFARKFDTDVDSEVLDLLDQDAREGR